MPLMIKLNRNVVRVYLCLDNGHFITVLAYMVMLASVLVGARRIKAANM